MPRSAHPYADTHVIDSRAPRTNQAVIGVVSVLAGYSTGVETLEFPVWVMPFLVLPYVVIVIANFTMYARKKTQHTYVSQWYLMAVTVWFPVLVLSAEACINFGAVDGVAQAIANWWYGHNVVGLFATPTGIAAAYYLIWWVPAISSLSGQTISVVLRFGAAFALVLTFWANLLGGLAAYPAQP